ncbi:MAG: hypothetical protein DRG50_03300, partial [Deltaproteobacteria bacterium]
MVEFLIFSQKNERIYSMKKDVVVIGAGCAGMVAALEAQVQGAEVVIIDRGPIGIGSNSALSNGVFAGPTMHYSPEEYIRDTIQTGKEINCELLVRLMAKEAPHAFSLLRSLGIELVELARNYVIKSPCPELIPGVTLVRVLAERIKNLRGVDKLTGLYVTEILKNSGEVFGVRGFDRAGEDAVIYAPTVVLASGGAAAIYLRSDNQKGIMGQGYYLAAKAGLDLWDMEFVQFYPFVIAEPGLPSFLLYPPYPKEARLLDADGKDILKKYDIDNPNEAILTRRDEFSTVLFEECLRGPLYMDYRSVPDSAWERHPLSLLRRMKFDFRSKLFAVSPAAHFFIGGVRIDEEGQTSLPGLFACGEVAWGLHGANRMGGNALTECIVFGRIAGRNAAKYAFIHHRSSSNLGRLSEGLSRHRSSNQRMLGELRRRIREIAWRYAGVVRSEREMREGLTKLTDLEMELKTIVPQTVSERRLWWDLTSAVF